MRTLLPLASRSESTASPQQVERRTGLRLRVYLTLVVCPATPLGLLVIIRGFSNNQPSELTAGGEPLTEPGTYIYELGAPAAAPPLGNIMESSPRAVPSCWDVLVKHGTTPEAPTPGAKRIDDYSYQVQAELV